MQIYTREYIYTACKYTPGTKCKSIFTFTHHVFENFSKCECKVNLLTVCKFLHTEFWLILVAAFAFILLQFFSLSLLLLFLHPSTAVFNCSEYLNHWKCLLSKCLLVILWFYQLFASYSLTKSVCVVNVSSLCCQCMVNVLSVYSQIVTSA